MAGALTRMLGRNTAGASLDPQVSFLHGYNSVEEVTGAWATDESSYHHVATQQDAGNNLIADTTAKFGSRALYRNAGGILRYPDHASLSLGSSAHTIECWARFEVSPASGIHTMMAKYDVNSASTGEWNFYINAGVLTMTYSFTVGGATSLTASPSWSTGVWYYFCCDYDGSKYRMYRATDGDANTVMLASLSATKTITDTATDFSVGDDIFNGNPAGRVTSVRLDEIRITKGTARYANDSGFAVPTSAFPRS